ncbi:hypothetical protein EVAR_44383_1 [Eumeta japonica]|uniref:Mos1 transposase HTH domain-containing protein n=1 Tax=Eumeta variegata TaxID=151549 RepID=A0A4C1X7J7_EUMVA|nr:hypothetical protein EVAR_44383_1 [Eumeta japonica]
MKKITINRIVGRHKTPAAHHEAGRRAIGANIAPDVRRPHRAREYGGREKCQFKRTHTSEHVCRQKRPVVYFSQSIFRDGGPSTRAVYDAIPRNAANDTLPIKCSIPTHEADNPLVILLGFEQEGYNRLQLAFHDESPSLATVCNWFNEFKRSRINLTDDLREGRRCTATTEDDISAVRLMIETDKRVTYQQIQTRLGIASCTVFIAAAERSPTGVRPRRPLWEIAAMTTFVRCALTAAARTTSECRRAPVARSHNIVLHRGILSSFYRRRKKNTTFPNATAAPYLFEGPRNISRLRPVRRHAEFLLRTPEPRRPFRRVRVFTASPHMFLSELLYFAAPKRGRPSTRAATRAPAARARTPPAVRFAELLFSHLPFFFKSRRPLFTSFMNEASI